MKTFDTYSFGCRVNQAEMESLGRELTESGLQKNPNAPDLYIINTCSVTHRAESEALKHIRFTRKKLPKSKIVITGCAATNWSKLNKEPEEIDYMVDNPNKKYLSELILKRFQKSLQQSGSRIPPIRRAGKSGMTIDISKNYTRNESINKYLSSSNSDIFPRSKRIIIKIQDGCHRFCSFCIVPYLRGLPQTISIDEIVKKVNSYPDFSEVVLTAINTEAYGRENNQSLTDLIQKVLRDTQIKRISFGSIHPWTFDDNFFKLLGKLKSNDRFVKFFHIPLQSGSNKILNLMKRGYTREEFVEKLNKIADINPFSFIATDVIVGYLEETDADFEDTYNFLKKTPISRFHVFRFSKRQHTAAYHMSRRLKEPSSIQKKEGSMRLRKLSEQKFLAFQKKHIGHEFKALFLEKRKNGHQFALLENQMPAFIKCDMDFTGEILNVKIESCKKGTLKGKIVR